MGKVKTNAAIKGFSNNIDGFVYYERDGRTLVRPYRKPANPNTMKQKKVRSAFLALVEAWKHVDGILRESWRIEGRKKKISGYCAFLGRNANFQRSGAPLALSVGNNGMAAPSELVAATGANPGEIQVSFQPVNGGHHLAIFTQKKENGAAGGPLARHDAGGNAASPFTVAGLEAGKTYHVYAVVTDEAYDAATGISASSAAEAVAG
ncbi:MAG: hypothetical protein KBA61_12430 [Spirochaetes bacterium]|nr:hypothetical protein [Spirochaetota bacterium]